MAKPRWPFYGYNSAGVLCQRSSRAVRGTIAAGATTALGIFWIKRQPVASIGDTWKGYGALAVLVACITYTAINFPKCD